MTDEEPRILLVEDDPATRLELSHGLRQAGFAVEAAADGERGLHAACRGGFDALILEAALDAQGGLDICRNLRRLGDSTPILMLAPPGRTEQTVQALASGADDYVIKPFEHVELIARVHALLRRNGNGASAAAETFELGDVHVDFRSTEVRRRDSLLRLSAKEFQLLRFFIEHRGETLSRQTLLQRVWGYETPPATRTVDVHVGWLRRKLETDPKDPKIILTLHGLGYKFVA
ncbi:MAG: response regulator transcription factor [Bryobacterales bacterium]|nr:response regulator transcription factor [Acidobacteriota bacterium]MCB9385880.1 response regulator transcription factor [Bryobacterales bacterium]